MMRVYILIVSVWAVSAEAAQPLGRLFFTPEERAALDASRGQQHVPKKSAAMETAPVVPPTPQIITFNGLVRRSDGTSTVWLNHRALTEREMRSGGPVTGHIRSDGTLTLQVPQTGARVDLKVGQRAELPSRHSIAPATPMKVNGAQSGHTPEKARGEAADIKGAPAHAQ